jgi:hypothetical protein
MQDQNGPLQDGVPGIDAWAPWHPNEVVKRLAGAPAAWCVVGGWALDLWLRQQTRPHHDLEIAVLRRDFATLRAHLTCFKCFAVAGGSVSVLPADSFPGPLQHQIWVLDEPAKAWSNRYFSRTRRRSDLDFSPRRSTSSPTFADGRSYSGRCALSQTGGRLDLQSEGNAAKRRNGFQHLRPGHGHHSTCLAEECYGPFVSITSLD